MLTKVKRANVIIYYQMSTDTNFSGWLQEELKKRGMSQADLSRKSGLSTAAVSRIMGGSRGVGAEACTAIARALKLPPETVFRQAGLLPWEPEEPVDPPTFWEWVMFYVRANKGDRDKMLEMAEELAKQQDEEEDKE